MGKWKKVISTASHKGEDYTGRKIGHWTVIRLVSNTGHPKYNQIWECECDCGHTHIVDKDVIIYGHDDNGCRDCVGERHRAANNANWKGHKEIPRSYFYSLQDGAKSRSIPFHITIEEAQALWEKSQGICGLSGLPIEMGKTASLDRIDSRGEYTLANLQWIHKDVNRMKNKYSQPYFIEICKAVAGRN